MTDIEALQSAVVAAPEDDALRLVLADAFEETGDAAYANFIRGDVERAKHKPWDRYAVKWDRGRIPGADANLYRHHLPEIVDGWHVEWDVLNAFRRGLPGALRIRTLHTFQEISSELFDLAPVEELALPTASLDEWREFARQPWLPRIKKIRFAGLSTPIRPIRCLCESPLATGIEEIYFDKANSPAMPELVAALQDSPLRQQLKGLHFRVGFDSVQELVEAFGEEDWPQLESLTFVTIGLNAACYRVMGQLPFVKRIKTFQLANETLNEEAQIELLRLFNQLKAIEDFSLRNVQFEDHWDRFYLSEITSQKLDISNTGMGYGSFLTRSSQQLSSLICANNSLDLHFQHFTGNDHLIELDYSNNTMNKSGLDYLLTSGFHQLEWLDLRNTGISRKDGQKLRDKFGDRVRL